MCAILKDTALTCWGFNEYAQCDIPFKFTNNIVLITAGSLFSCALNSNREWSCWGLQEYKDEDWTSKIFLAVVQHNGNIEMVVLEAGGMHVCIVCATIGENEHKLK